MLRFLSMKHNSKECLRFLSMAFGMLPIALAQGTASEWKNGLAWVIIGGLLSSLILTVYLVPVVYYVVDRVKERWGGR